MTDATDVFGRDIACECGRTHHIEPREVAYGPDALDGLSEMCARYADGRDAAVLMDVRTREAAGERVCGILEAGGWRVLPLLVPDPAEGASPVCDDETKGRVASGLGPVSLFVSVGSGVISDMAKWLALERGLPCVACPTAASMNGYASANIAPTIKGVKSLMDARPAIAIAADSEVIQNAPWELTASGLGDILAKSVSGADWLMNHLLFGDFYCARATGLITDIEPLYMNRPEDLKARQPQAVAALFRGLLLTGVAMTMAGTSFPSSGGEHMVSHTLDMMSSVDGEPHGLHGRQVGIGTVIGSELYRRILAVESPEFRDPGAGVDEPFWGRLAPLVAQEYEAKLPRMAQAREILSQGDAWDGLRRGLAPMLRPPAAVRECLRRAGAAWRAEDIPCRQDRLLTSLLHSHEIRSRFTVLDLARMLGILPGAAEEIVDEWAG